MQQDFKEDKTYFLPYTFPAPRIFSEYDPLSLEDDNRLGYGPAYQVNINGTECIIYTDHLHWFLKLNKVVVNNTSGELDEVVLNGTIYNESYKTGFQSGIAYFNEKYRFDKYAPILGLDNYIKELKNKYFNGCNDPLLYPGWIGVRRSRIGLLSHKIIWGHGYYAGIYSQVEQLMRDYVFIKDALSSNPKKLPSPKDIGDNKFNGMSLEDVKSHFVPLTTKKSTKNKEPFLTLEKFELFINKAFCKNDSIEMQTANLGDGELEIMGALFLLYYEKCKNLGHFVKGQQKDYVGLLTENFTNYMHLKDTLPTNFTKYKEREKAWSNTI